MTERADSTIASPAHVNGALYLPKPRRKPFRVSRERRKRIEACVEGLLHLLDIVDEADEDMEDNGDAEPEESGYGDGDGLSVEETGEPLFGWTSMEAGYGRYASTFDCNGEGEPSLGWTASTKQHGPNWLGGTDDAEHEHDGREPEHEGPDGDEGDYSEGDDRGGRSFFGDPENRAAAKRALAQVRKIERRREAAP